MDQTACSREFFFFFLIEILCQLAESFKNKEIPLGVEPQPSACHTSMLSTTPT